MRIAVQTSLPAGGPASLMNLSPPGVLLLNGSNAARLMAKISAGTITFTPKWWSETLQAWIPAQASTVLGTYSVTADMSTPVISDIFTRTMEAQWWAVLVSGGGTVSYCDLEEAHV